MSQTNIPMQSFDPSAVDSAEFRAFFLSRFAQWLQLNFKSPEAVAAAFGVRFTTACNWWNGENRAGGDLTAMVFMTFPNAVAFFLQEWADR